jgi:hypothetical protein
MLSTLKKTTRRLLLLTLVIAALSFGAPTTNSQTVPRITLCEFDSSTQITTCDSFGSSAGYFRYQCDTSGHCWLWGS